MTLTAPPSRGSSREGSFWSGPPTRWTTWPRSPRIRRSRRSRSRSFLTRSRELSSRLCWFNFKMIWIGTFCYILSDDSDILLTSPSTGLLVSLLARDRPRHGGLNLRADLRPHHGHGWSKFTTRGGFVQEDVNASDESYDIWGMIFSVK